MGLPVDAPEDASDAMADRLEHHVRRLGIPLSAAEAVAETMPAAEGFIAACEAGRGRAYAADLQDEEPPSADGQDPTVRVRVTADPPKGTDLRDGSAATRQA